MIFQFSDGEFSRNHVIILQREKLIKRPVSEKNVHKVLK